MRYFKRPVWMLPSVAIADRLQLPKTSGIYYAAKDGRIQYVGRAANFRTRWSGHHQASHLCGDGWRLHYRQVSRFLYKGREWEEIRAHRARGSNRPALNDLQGSRPKWWRLIEVADFLVDSAIVATLIAIVVLITKISLGA